MINRKEWRRLGIGIQFLAPNILGFATFTMLPLVFSIVMACSNYNLLRYNRFQHSSLTFPTAANFVRLWGDPDFWSFLRNTLFFLLAVPIGIAASLLAAMALNVSPGAGKRGVRVGMIATAIFVTGLAALLLAGAGASAIACLLILLPCGLFVLGAFAGSNAYRTLFYVPSFTSGVAIFIVWAKLYNPNTGPINSALAPMLRGLSAVVMGLPAIVPQVGYWICLGLIAVVLFVTVRRLRILWGDGDLSLIAGLGLVGVLVVGVGLIVIWLPSAAGVFFLMGASGVIVAWQVGVMVKEERLWCRGGSAGAAVMVVMGSVCLQFVIEGIGIVLFNLRANAAVGLTPPSWLTQYYWAKPALMLMGLWLAIGSNNMLLYLAALSNMPAELYEAADIDGAGRLARFWNVTWPQLAPTTFLITITSVIGGLQGGFDSARAMTDGGPAGSTTTLAYFIYSQGFQSGDLGYASAIAWVMFIMILGITVINWKWGGQYVND